MSSRRMLPEYFHKLQKLPSEYFRDNWYATFWFETGRGDLQHLIDAVGEDKIMFETDFPHPTCLHPNPVEMVTEKMSHAAPRDAAQDHGRERRSSSTSCSVGTRPRSVRALQPVLREPEVDLARRGVGPPARHDLARV